MFFCRNVMHSLTPVLWSPEKLCVCSQIFCIHLQNYYISPVTLAPKIIKLIFMCEQHLLAKRLSSPERYFVFAKLWNIIFLPVSYYSFLGKCKNFASKHTFFPLFSLLMGTMRERKIRNPSTQLICFFNCSHTVSTKGIKSKINLQKKVINITLYL